MRGKEWRGNGVGLRGREWGEGEEKGNREIEGMERGIGEGTEREERV